MPELGCHKDDSFPIMKEELRKVVFNLNELNLTIGDLGYKDPEGILVERHGYFHRLGDIIVYDPELGKNLPKTIAIIEEIDTGKVYEVAPHCFRFEKE